MNVFVTGAAGFIGGSIATGLIQAGHSVKGLVRNAEQADELKALGITPVIGTLDDSALLADQARAADAVINAVYYRNSQLALRIQCFLDFIQSKLALYATDDFND